MRSVEWGILTAKYTKYAKADVRTSAERREGLLDEFEQSGLSGQKIPPVFALLRLVLRTQPRSKGGGKAPTC